jgi:hypothetical protein
MSSQPEPNSRSGPETTTSAPAPSTKADVAFLRRKLAHPSITKPIGALKGIVEPYVIYGATQRIYEKCAAQADYTISEADRKSGKLELAEDGEEIGQAAGEGSNVWHTGKGYRIRVPQTVLAQK